MIQKAVTVPGWLAKHQGTLSVGSDGHTWFVVFDGEPQYRLVPVPAHGQFTCHVSPTINSRRLNQGGVFPSKEEAVEGGLEDLRKLLGW
jgi:hypothetical protein